MRLSTTAKFLVRVNSESGMIWVSFNEFGDYDRTEPYIQNSKEREEVVRLAKKYVKGLAETFS